MRIKTKTSLLFLVLALTPAALIGVVAYWASEESLRNNLGQGFAQSAAKAAERVDQHLFEIYQNGRSWSELDLMQEVEADDSEGQISLFLTRLLKERSYFSNLEASSADGRIVASSSPERIGESLVDNPLWEAVRSGEIRVRDAAFDQRTRQWIVQFMFPILSKSDGRFLGALAVDWRALLLPEMVRMRGDDLNEKATYALLARRDGLILAAPRFRSSWMYGRNLGDEGLESLRRAQAGDSDYTIESVPMGDRVLIGFAPSRGYRQFRGLGWITFVVQDAEAALASVDRLKWVYFYGGLATVLAAVFLSLWVSGRFTRPVLALAEGARRIASGDFDYRVKVLSDDEIGMLSGTFNEMAAYLKSQRAQLVQKDYLDSVINTAIDGIVIVDGKGLVELFNPAAEQMFGYGSDEIRGTPLETLLPASRDRLATGMIRQVTARRKKGSHFPADLSISEVNVGGRQTFTIIVRDISEQTRMIALLLKQTQDLARSNSDLEQFAYIASHDLQEPLRMVASYTKLLSDRYKGKLDADADTFIGYAVEGAARMRMLIEDLLTYSRVGTKAKPLAPVESQSIFEKAIDNLKIAIEEKQASVRAETPLPQVMADDVALLQLFQNLIGNALKFSRPEEPPRIEVGAEARDEEWVFFIRDNGVGIESEYFERIFEIFQRLHSRAEYAGTGIGLAVCKKIMEKHGGRIWLESELGKGTTFYFNLPAVPAQ